MHTHSSLKGQHVQRPRVRVPAASQGALQPVGLAVYPGATGSGGKVKPRQPRPPSGPLVSVRELAVKAAKGRATEG